MGNIRSTNSQPTLESAAPKLHSFDLRHSENTFKIKQYGSSRFFSKQNLLLRGECGNPDKKTRNAMLTATDMTDGTIIGI